MKHVKLFEQFVNEAIDTKSAYPYRLDHVGKGDDGVYNLEYEFKSAGGKEYDVTLIIAPNKSQYEFNFKTKNGWFDTMTRENDSFRILATVGSIFKDALSKHVLLPVTIKINGMHKAGENTEEQSARDRIYKHMLQKELRHIKPGNPLIKTYDLGDMHEDGLVLEPISIDMDDDFDDEYYDEENEGLNMFNDKQDKVM
jgi:hypothetical protein